jgi:enterochelin esterase family protein
LHAVTVRLPDQSRVEYELAVTVGGHTSGHLDPFNPERASNPFGMNSVAFGPGYRTPWWAAPAEANGGELRRGFVDSKAFGQRRFVHWYHPHGTHRRIPLLLVHDGNDFVHHADLVHVLDNLIAAGLIPPVMVALIDSPDRLTEYTDDSRHAAFVGEVVAAAVRRHGASSDPSSHVYLGASLGGVAALAAAWRKGGVGGLVLLSGSFVTALGGPMERGERFLPVIDFMERFAADPGRPAARIYQACGDYEGLAPDNRAFTPILEATGASLRHELTPDGHHWHNWRDRLADALPHTLAAMGKGRPGTVRA